MTESPGYIKRMEKECKDLYARYQKPQRFMQSPKFFGLICEEKKLMYKQAMWMREYRDVLLDRIALAKEKEETNGLV